MGRRRADEHEVTGRGERAPDRRARMVTILHRDGVRCVWCGRPLEHGLVRATTEHVVPRIKGGPSWLENEVAACARCNRERGHRSPAEWLTECEGRGWPADRTAIVRSLRALEAAIVERGGQRRARAYVASQLRRLDQRGAGTSRGPVTGRRGPG